MPWIIPWLFDLLCSNAGQGVEVGVTACERMAAIGRLSLAAAVQWRW